MVVVEEVHEDPVPEDRGSHGVQDRDRPATVHRRIRLRQLLRLSLDRPTDILLTRNHLVIRKLVKRNWNVKNWQDLMHMAEKIGANVQVQPQKYQQ